jgi:hypothetical protein
MVSNLVRPKAVLMLVPVRCRILKLELIFVVVFVGRRYRCCKAESTQGGSKKTRSSTKEKDKETVS